MVKLEDWAVGVEPKDYNPYTPIEHQHTRLSGLVYEHALHKDGKRVKTSRILKVDGNVVETESGTLYELGECNKDYVEWCKQYGCHVPTKEEPILCKK